MFNQIYAITIKEFKALLRDGGALAALFILPVVFVSIMTYAGVGNQGVRSPNILVVNQDQGKIAERIIDRLRTEKGIKIQTEVNGTALLQNQAENMLVKRGSNIGFVIVFPSDFSSSLMSNAENKPGTPQVQFIVDPATGGENLFTYERLVEIQVMNVAGALAAARMSESTLNTIIASEPSKTQNLFSNLNNKFLENMRNVDTKIDNRVQFKQETPQGWSTFHVITPKEQNVPGYTIFGVFFIVQVIGNTILREKESGTFNRLLVAPIRRSVILIGKLIPFYIVNIIQVMFLFAFGYFVFHISLGNSPLGLFAVTLAAAASANALGLLIASISKSVEQMGPLSSVILIVMATAGGILIPFFEMPKMLQQLAFFTPQAWALKGYQDILVRGYDFHSVLPSVGALLLFAVLFYALALLKFRFE